MRTGLIVSMLLATPLGGCAGARRPAPGPAEPSAAERAALLEAREAVWRAYFAGDSARLVELLPERMVGMGENRAGIIASAQAFRRGGGALSAIEFSDDEVVMRDGMAVTYAKYRVLLEHAGKRDSMVGFAIELFVKLDGRWINPSWHLHQAP
jgi:hypothetical protein